MSELTIGFDLGSSTTKVVVRDINRRSVYQIPIGGPADRFILPSIVYHDPETKRFSLTQAGPDDWEFSGLKCDLLKSGQRGSMVIATAYIACVMQRVLHWLLVDNEDTRLTYAHELAIDGLPSESSWFGNIGVPLEMHESEAFTTVRDRFSKVLFAGVVMALEKRNVTTAEVSSVLQGIVTDPAYDIHTGCFCAFPEVVGLAGEFMESKHANSSVVAFLDIGAETVDLAVLNMVRQSGLRYNQYYSSVRNYGCYVVARRIFEESSQDFGKWLHEHGGMGARLPDFVLKRDASKIARDVDLDGQLSFGFNDEMATMYVQGIKVLQHTDPHNTWHWRENGVTIYLMGGGRGMVCYSDQILYYVNDERTRALDAKGYVIKPFPKSAESPPEYERTCVAHGLSRSKFDLERLNRISSPPQGYDRPGPAEPFGLPPTDKDAG